MEIMCISRENYRLKDKNDIETSRKTSRAFSSLFDGSFFLFFFLLITFVKYQLSFRKCLRNLVVQFSGW